MRRLLYLFSFFVIPLSLMAQERIISPAAKMEKTEVIKPVGLQFEESEFDFGKIPQGRPVMHIFKFKNTGNIPVVLNDVHASCGCTTPEWSRDTIPAGGSSFIKIGYNSAAEGTFVKPVFVTYNGGQTKNLIIKGEVWATPVHSAPENELVNKFNKQQ